MRNLDVTKWLFPALRIIPARWSNSDFYADINRRDPRINRVDAVTLSYQLGEILLSVHWRKYTIGRMSYYVFHASPMSRARVHKGSCVHCNYGTGQPGQDKTGSGNTGWSKPFPTVVAAQRYMNTTFPNFKDARTCQTCKP